MIHKVTLEGNVFGPSLNIAKQTLLRLSPSAIKVEM